MRFKDNRAARQPVLEESRLLGASERDGTQLVQLIFAGLIVARWVVSWWRKRGEPKAEK